MAITVRDELVSDRAAICSITQAAFEGKPYASGDEQDVVDRLRNAGALSLSLVAVDGEEMLGQASFSPAVNEDGSSPWFALGPISVSPGRQAEGIGGILIREGFARLQAMNALGCILTGDPNYYQRFGFKVTPEFCAINEPAEYFQLKLFADQLPSGRFSFHSAFYE